MELSETSARRRTAIRAHVKQLVCDSVEDLPNAAVFTARAEAPELEDFVSIYFDEIDREAQHNRPQADGDLVIRISTKVEPQEADDRLDEISGYIEMAVDADPKLGGLVWRCFMHKVIYADSPSGIYSSVELFFQLKYDD